jgi:putative Ca2+/H+ antiporter (TMEM165/GDT1 family)
MANLTLSDKYGIAAVLGMLVIVVVNSTLAMLIISVIGIIGGLWVMRKGEVRRVVYVSLAAFAIAAALAVYGLVQRG